MARKAKQTYEEELREALIDAWCKWDSASNNYLFPLYHSLAKDKLDSDLHYIFGPSDTLAQKRIAAETLIAAMTEHLRHLWGTGKAGGQVFSLRERYIPEQKLRAFVAEKMQIKLKG